MFAVRQFSRQEVRSTELETLLYVKVYPMVRLLEERLRRMVARPEDVEYGDFVHEHSRLERLYRVKDSLIRLTNASSPLV